MHKVGFADTSDRVNGGDHGAAFESRNWLKEVMPAAMESDDGAESVRDGQTIVRAASNGSMRRAASASSSATSAKATSCVHFSVLKEHGRRSLPEGAVIECLAAEQERGLQARKMIMSIDLGSGLAAAGRARSMPPSERADRKALARCRRRVRAGGGQMVQSRERLWLRQSAARTTSGEDIFVHMETVRAAQPSDLQPGQPLRGADRRGPQGPDRGRAPRTG